MIGNLYSADMQIAMCQILIDMHYDCACVYALTDTVYTLPMRTCHITDALFAPNVLPARTADP